MNIRVDDAIDLLVEKDEKFRKLKDKLDSAVNCLRDIADMSKKVGSETAANWLQSHGYARTKGGYIPGKGFNE